MWSAGLITGVVLVEGVPPPLGFGVSGVGVEDGDDVSSSEDGSDDSWLEEGFEDDSSDDGSLEDGVSSSGTVMVEMEGSMDAVGVDGEAVLQADAPTTNKTASKIAASFFILSPHLTKSVKNVVAKQLFYMWNPVIADRIA